MKRGYAFGIDLVLVVAFVIIGRLSHTSGVFSVGTLQAIWPFVVGLLIGWLPVWLLNWPPLALRTGTLIWASTLGFGLLVRWVFGQGVALSFIVVASLVLAAFLIGWRGILGRTARRTPTVETGTG